MINMCSTTNGEKIRGVWTYCVDGIHTLPAFIPFSLHPVSVEISEQSVDIIGSRRVPIPLPGVVL